MARSPYIYVVRIHRAILWIGTVKHEMRTFLEGHDRYPLRWLTVARYADGTVNTPVSEIPAEMFMHTDKIP